MPFVSGFTLRFFEFSVAVVVADRSRVGPETNVYIGVARARTCERTTLTMIDGRPCAIESVSAIYLFISPLHVIFWFAIRKTRARCKFQRALRSKRPGKLPRRGSQQMVSHLLDHLNDSRAWEVILVTTLSLCSFSICSCIFSSSSSSSFFIFVLGKSRFFFFVSVARNRLRVELELRKNDTAIVNF